MKIVINTNTTTSDELRSMANFLLELVKAKELTKWKPGQLPKNLTISTGPIEYDPDAVMVYTSTDGAAAVKSGAVKIPTVDDREVKVEVVEKVGANLDVVASGTIHGALGCEPAKDVDNTLDKVRQGLDEIDAKKAKKAVESKPKPPVDAKAVVEAVVGVKTQTVEAEGTVEEVVEKLDKGEALIDKDAQKKIKALSLQCAKYGKMPEAKEKIRNIVNSGGPVKLGEIPAKHGDAVVKALEAIKEGAENDG